MKKFIIPLTAILLIGIHARPQGCVIVRNISGFGQYNLTDNAYSTSDWQINITSRYFKSFRDYKGKIDQETPEQNQSVNHVYSMDISLSRMLNNGWSLNLSIPITSNKRITSAEHGGANTKRHSTSSFGIGDIRFTAYKWVLKPTVKQKGNFQIGLGMKFPTGDYKYQDYFYRNDSTKVLAPVNPSIQLGDGGTGIIGELNAFYYLNHQKTIGLYGNMYYLINPREQNGTSTTVGRTPTSIQIKSGAVETSVTDQYSLRAGINLKLKAWALSAGVRNEGIPVNDLLGGSNGTRRAGHNLSFEPGIVYKMKKITLYSYVPVIVGRKIKQSVPDKLTSEITGVYTESPGGFGNYLLFVGVSVKL